MGYSVFPAASSGISVADGLAAGFASPVWTQIASVTSTGASGYSFTGLEGYRRIRFTVTGIQTSGVAGGMVYITFNSDSGSNYSNSRVINHASSTTPFRISNNANTTSFELSGIQISGYTFHTTVEFENIAGSWKHCTHRTFVSGEDYNGPAAPAVVHGFCNYQSTTVISSMAFQMPSVTNNGNGKLYIWGQV